MHVNHMSTISIIFRGVGFQWQQKGFPMLQWVFRKRRPTSFTDIFFSGLVASLIVVSSRQMWVQSWLFFSTVGSSWVCSECSTRGSPVRGAISGEFWVSVLEETTDTWVFQFLSVWLTVKSVSTIKLQIAYYLVDSVILILIIALNKILPSWFSKWMQTKLVEPLHIFVSFIILSLSLLLPSYCVLVVLDCVLWSSAGNYIKWLRVWSSPGNYIKW